jgi:hypothetical protein
MFTAVQISSVDERTTLGSSCWGFHSSSWLRLLTHCVSGEAVVGEEPWVQNDGRLDTGAKELPPDDYTAHDS